MQRLSKYNIEKLQKYFASQKDVVAVYLYGSFAKETTHKKSDIDFGVLVNPPIKTYRRLGEMGNDLCRLLLLKTEVDVRNLSLDQSPVYLLNVIQGQLIYARNEIEKINFEVTVMRRFYDTQRLRDISYSYLKSRLEKGAYGY